MNAKATAVSPVRSCNDVFTLGESKGHSLGREPHWQDDSGAILCRGDIRCMLPAMETQ